MTLRTLKTAVTLSAFVTLFSCRVEKGNESETQYAGGSYLTNSSYLKQMNATGAIEACIQPIGGSQQQRQDSFSEVSKALADAAADWNEVLIGQPGWNQRSIKVNAVPRDYCTPSSGVVTINIYLSESSFQQLCIKNFPSVPVDQLPTRCRSHAMPPTHVINIESGSSGYSMRYLILHEFAHLLGLGDTYYEKGYIAADAVAGQPDSVMNGRVQNIAADDRDGLRAVWRAIREGSSANFCANGYVAKSGAYNMVYCKPVGNIAPVTQVNTSTKTSTSTSTQTTNSVCPAVTEAGFNLKVNQRYTYAGTKTAVFVRELNDSNQVDETSSTSRSNRCELIEISCTNSVIEKVGSYVKVKFSDGQKGYVHGSQVTYHKAADCEP